MLIVVIIGASLIAAGGAMFGIAAARIFWAQDLRHALELKVIWDKTRAAMESTISNQSSTIETQKRTIAIIKGETTR